MRFAYADPPYFGCGARLYGEHHPEAAVWDQVEVGLPVIGYQDGDVLFPGTSGMAATIAAPPLTFTEESA